MQIIPARKTPFADQMMKEISQNMGTGFERLFNKGQTRKEINAQKLAQGKSAEAERLLRLKEQLKGEAKEKNLNRISELLGKGKKGTKNPESTSEQNIKDGVDQDSLDFENIPDETIAEITMIDPVAGKALGEAKKSKLKEKERNETKFQKERDFHSKYTDPILAGADRILENAPSRKGLMRQWRQDIESGNTSGFGQFMVDKSGLEFWRTPESARSLAAGKHYFMDTLHSLSAGTKLNQFLEKNLYAALPQIGRDKESQLSVLDMQDFLDDLKEEKAKIEVRLADEDIEKEGFVNKDISRRAQNELEDYANQRQEKLAFDIRKTHEDLRTDKDLINEITSGKVPKGAPITPRMMAILKIINNDDTDKAIKQAIDLGFELPRRKK